MSDKHEPVDDRLIRYAEIEHLTGIKGRPALRRLIRTQGFPPPIEFTGARACAWSLRAVRSWIATRVALRHRVAMEERDAER